MNSKVKKMLTFFFLSILLFAFNNCSEFEGAGTGEFETVLSSISLNCPVADDSLKNPTEFKHVIDLINSLPKPLTAECFIANLSSPLNLVALSSTLSNQPAEGPDKPRVLIIRDNFIITVVASNLSQPILEFSRVISPGVSVRGELYFPVTGELSDTAAFDNIIDKSSATRATSCRFCHRNEVDLGDGSFASEQLRPGPFSQVKKQTMLNVLATCDEANEPFRCRVVQAIYGRAEVNDIAWPF